MCSLFCAGCEFWGQGESQTTVSHKVEVGKYCHYMSLLLWVKIYRVKHTSIVKILFFSVERIHININPEMKNVILALSLCV